MQCYSITAPLQSARESYRIAFPFDLIFTQLPPVSFGLNAGRRSRKGRRDFAVEWTLSGVMIMYVLLMDGLIGRRVNDSCPNLCPPPYS